MPDATATSGHVAGESRSENIVAIVSAMMALASAVLLVRIWTRYQIQGIPSGADEWSIIASWAFSTAFTVNVCLQTRHGLGKHKADLTADTNAAAALELFFYGEATYYITVSLTKVSILFLYLKVIPHSGYRIASYVMMGFVALTGFTCVVAGIFQCKPIRKAWHTDLPGTCFNQVALYLANAGLNIFQDLVVYFLPVRTLWNLQLPRKQRIALVAVFVVGAFVCLTGILRLESLTMASVSKDPTCKDNYGAAIWSSIESNVGIICASLVHLKPLIARYAPSLLGIRTTTRLPDERSGPAGPTEDSSSKINRSRRSMGRSGKSKPFGILTEMELEDRYNDEAAIVRPMPKGSGTGYNSDGYASSTTPTQDAERQHPSIQKTTHVAISYRDRGPGTYPERACDGFN